MLKSDIQIWISKDHLDYIHFDSGFHDQNSLMHLGINENTTLFCHFSSRYSNLILALRLEESRLEIAR